MCTKLEVLRLSVRVDRINRKSLRRLGCGFPVQWQQSSAIPLRDLYAQIQEICGYTILVNEHCQGIATQESLAGLADRRNYIQYQTISLPSHPGKGPYEATRLATLIYSLLVVFPMAAHEPPFATLATLIREELLTLDLPRSSNEESGLLCWILVLGALVAIGTDERPWFVYSLSNAFHGTWEDLKRLLEQFLWLGSTSNSDGNTLWAEMIKAQSLFEEGSSGSSYTESSSPFTSASDTSNYGGRTPHNP